MSVKTKKEINDIEADEITERDNLAVVARIERLEAIKGKDFVELVHLKDVGFTFICEKGHKVDDLVVYVKYDTVVPDNELFAFMKETKFRVKAKAFTEKNEDGNVVGRIYSQGIILPLQKVKDFYPVEDIWLVDVLEGTDLTTMFSVKKYIPPVQGSGSNFGNMLSKGNFPVHIVSKTDEVNLASKMKALTEIQGMNVYITQKIEGSSITITWDEENDELMVCSRNNQIYEHETNKFWQAVNKYSLKNKLKAIPKLVLQAELASPGVQKNKLGLTEPDLFVFNVSDKDSRKRFDYEASVDMCLRLGVPFVPEVKVVFGFTGTFDELQELADTQVYANGEKAEGIVVRPMTPFFSRVLKDIWSVKVLNREYKL